MKLREYLNEGLDAKKALKKMWGEADLKVVYKWGKSNGAWVVIAKHPSTKKYYGINYLDEIIDGVSKQKAIDWAEDFTGTDVKLKG